MCIVLRLPIYPQSDKLKFTTKLFKNYELPLICLRQSEQISCRHFDVDDELTEKNESNVKNHDASLFDQTDVLPLRDCWTKCLIRDHWSLILELYNLEQAKTPSTCNIHY